MKDNPVLSPRRLYDAGFVFLSALLVIIIFISQWQFLSPAVDVYSDIAGNILSQLSADQFPSHFREDLLASSEGTFDVYTISLNYMIEAVYSVVGDYGLATYLIGVPVMLLSAIGYYWLGVVVLGKRLWATLFAWLCTFWGVGLNLGEYFGQLLDPIPRDMFSALLPFLLVAVIKWRHRPSRWVWIMVGAGLLAYIHPVSTPGWGFALWLGLWVYHPDSWSFWKRLTVMLGLGIVFLLVVLPFGFMYISTFEHGAVYDYSFVLQITEFRHLPGFYDIGLALTQFVQLTTEQMGLPLIFLVSLLLWYWLSEQRRRIYLMMILWIAGLLFVAVVLMFFDHEIARLNNQAPLQVDLIRGIRYLVPLGWLFFSWLLSEVVNQAFEQKYDRIAFALRGCGVFFAALIFVMQSISAYGFWQMDLLRTQSNLMTYLRDETDVTASVLGINEDVPLAVRYSGLRSISYTYKEGGILAYGNINRLLSWYRITQRIDMLREQSLHTALPEFITLAQQLRSEYILVTTSGWDDASRVALTTQAVDMGLELAYENTNYRLYTVPAADAPPDVHITWNTDNQQPQVYCRSDDRLEILDNGNSVISLSLDEVQHNLARYDQEPLNIATVDGVQLVALNHEVLDIRTESEFRYLFTLYPCLLDELEPEFAN